MNASSDCKNKSLSLYNKFLWSWCEIDSWPLTHRTYRNFAQTHRYEGHDISVLLQ